MCSKTLSGSSRCLFPKAGRLSSLALALSKASAIEFHHEHTYAHAFADSANTCSAHYLETKRTKHIIVRASVWSMLLCALRRILTPSLAARHHLTSSQTLHHVIRSLEPPILRSMANNTYIGPPVSSIDDDRQSEDVEALLAPLRKAVQEQVNK